MTQSSSDINAMSAAALRQVDRVCTRFESAWKTGPRPQIEEFWSAAEAADSPDSGVLLRELLILDLEYRSRSGERPAAQEYVSRFGTHSAAVNEAWEAHQVSTVEWSLPEIAGYEVLRRIGRGGMAVVYEARDRRLGRSVAIKLISSADPGEQTIARFRAEAQAVARLGHPNIVQIYEIGEHAGRPYLALEYVAGGSLAERIAGAPMPPQPAAELVGRIARAVHAAHLQGVVHRDLKPSNILLSKDGDQPKVADFGLVKFMDSADPKQTQSGVVLGTASYMAPEQAAGGGNGPIGPLADVYSLGAILYELITGRPPFKAATVFETAMLVRNAEPVAPRQLQPHTPRDLETICLKCLEKDPMRRYESAQALADDLDRFSAGAPVVARPVGTIARGWRWSRRNRAVAGLTGVVAVVLAGGTVVSTYFSIQSNRRAAENRRLAIEAQSKARQAQAVSDYLVNAFRSPDPARDGRGVTVAEVLDRAVTQLEKDFADQPQIKADLLHAIGVTYLDLGLPKPAVELLERSAGLMRTQSADADSRSLSLDTNLARAYRLTGDTTRAIALAQQTLLRLRPQFGDDHPDVLGTIRTLAHAYEQAGDWASALQLHEEVLRSTQQSAGPRDLATISAMGNLAAAYLNTAQLDRAIKLYEEALDLSRSALGARHAQTLVITNHLAVAYNNANQRDRAIAMMEQSLEISREVLGEDHPERLLAMGSLAQMYRQAGRAKDAVPIVRQILQQQRAKLGDDHPDTMNSISRLAITLQAAGELEQSLPYHREVFDRRRAKLGAEHPHTLFAMAGLGTALREAARFDEAESLLRQCAEIRLRTTPDDWAAHYTQLLYGRVLIDLNRFEEAEAQCLKGYAGLSARSDAMPPNERHRIRAAAQWIGQLYEKWEKPDQAAEWRKKQP